MIETNWERTVIRDGKAYRIEEHKPDTKENKEITIRESIRNTSKFQIVSLIVSIIIFIAVCIKDCIS